MRLETVGFLELNSVARGVEAADAMLKAAEVLLHFARPNCPGKFNILVSGEVSAVDASVEAGALAAGTALIERLVIPRIHPQVVEAIRMGAPAPEAGALGILEFFSITAAICGADAAVKAAEVLLLDVRLGTGLGGKSYILLTGDTSAVAQAVECGARAAEETGMLLARTVLPNPVPALYENLL